MKYKPASGGPLGRSLVDCAPETTSSSGLQACLMLWWRAGAGGFFCLPSVPRQLEQLLIHSISNSCKQRKDVMGISRLGQITTPLFITHLLIHRKEGEKWSLNGQLSMHSSWLLSPFQMYSE